MCTGVTTSKTAQMEVTRGIAITPLVSSLLVTMVPAIMPVRNVMGTQIAEIHLMNTTALSSACLMSFFVTGTTVCFIPLSVTMNQIVLMAVMSSHAAIQNAKAMNSLVLLASASTKSQSAMVSLTVQMVQMNFIALALPILNMSVIPMNGFVQNLGNAFQGGKFVMEL